MEPKQNRIDFSCCPELVTWHGPLQGFSLISNLYETNWYCRHRPNIHIRPWLFVKEEFASASRSKPGPFNIPLRHCAYQALTSSKSPRTLGVRAFSSPLQLLPSGRTLGCLTAWSTLCLFQTPALNCYFVFWPLLGFSLMQLLYIV